MGTTTAENALSGLSDTSAPAVRVPAMKTKTTTTMLAALVLAGLLGACGDDDSADGASDGGADDAVLDWVECMREEGIELSDPVTDPGGGVSLGDPGDASPEDMDAAQEVCGPSPGLGAQDLSEEDQQAAALEFAECMRNEGIDDFPDPDFSDTGPGGAAGESDEEVGVAPLAPFGDIDLDDPEVAAAFEACQDVLGQPTGAPSPGADAGASDT